MPLARIHVVEGRLRLRMPASGAFCLLRSPMMMFNGRSAKPWAAFVKGRLISTW
jgi:hypothetical protein